MSIAPNPPAADVDPRSKGERKDILIRFPVAMVERMNAAAINMGMARNDFVLTAVDALLGGGKPAKPAKATDIQAPAGTRLDKSKIGRRLTPKEKPGKSKTKVEPEEAF